MRIASKTSTIDSRYDFAQRTKQLLKGHRSLIDNNKDNKEVVVFREIADGVAASDENFDESETMLNTGPNAMYSTVILQT